MRSAPTAAGSSTRKCNGGFCTEKSSKKLEVGVSDGAIDGRDRSASAGGRQASETYGLGTVSSDIHRVV